MKPAAIFMTFFAASTMVMAQNNRYPWLADYDSANALCNLISTPEGFTRIEVEKGSFADWLRHLPIRKSQSEVFNYKKEKISGRDVSYAIVDMDIGEKDLLQCADAIIRFRAEYLYFNNRFDSISFQFTNGDTARYPDWIAGNRPIVSGNNVDWTKSVAIDSSYQNFQEYLETVFTYAGTYSIAKQMKSVSTIDSIQIGDAFVFSGFPGHAVLVTDMAVDNVAGRKMILLTQGFMPAQDVHVIESPKMPAKLPWFEINSGTSIEILFWVFTEENLRRF